MTGPQKLAALGDEFAADVAGIHRLIAAGDVAGLGSLLLAERETRYARDCRELRGRIAGGRSATVTDEQLRQIVDRVFRYRSGDLRDLRLHEIAATLQQANSECRELSAAWLSRRLGRLKLRHVVNKASAIPADNLSVLR